MQILFTGVIGLNDQTTKKQETTTKAAISLVSKKVLEKFPAATLTICKGIYTHEDKTRVKETSIKVEYLGTEKDKNAFIEVLRALKKSRNEGGLNQECITYIETPVTFDFI